MLRDFKSIEVLEEPEVLRRGCIFGWQLQSFANVVIETLGEFFIRTSSSKVVNWVQQKEFSTPKSGRGAGTIMRGALEAKLW